MKRFILHGDMADNFCKEVDLNVSTIREACSALSTLYPAFKPYFLKKTFSGIDFLFVDQKDTKYDTTCADIILKDSVYDIVAQPRGAAGAGDFMGTMGSMGMGFMQSMLMGFAMQKMVDMMSEEDDTPEYEIIETNSFLYQNVENKVEQGSPVPVIYGQLKVGSKIINASIDNFDYDYEDSEIYGYPQSKKNLSKILNGKHSFIVPKALVNGYEVGSWRKEASKMLMSFPGNNAGAAKSFNADAGNEPENLGHSSSASKGTYQNVYGPSVGGPLVPDGSSTTVPSKKGARPYVFPNVGSMHSYLRPPSASSLCIEKVKDQGNAASESLGYKSERAPMTVGNRGDFQKLESIAIYKSLEVLSEGPIAGLANPVEGDDYDNGYINYPVGASAAPAAGGAKISLGPIRYSETFNHFEDATTSSPVITIISNGKGYDIANGTYFVHANNEIDPVTKLTVKCSSPQSMSNATVDATVFSKTVDESDNYTTYDKNVDLGIPLYISSNKVFLLDSEDGRIVPNVNTNPLSKGNIDSKYFNLENVRDGTQKNVFDLSQLSSDSQNLKVSFSAGQGYTKEDKEFSISPYNGFPELEIDTIKNSTFDRSVRAQALDSVGLMGGVDGMATDIREGLISDYLSSSSSTIPNSSTGWDAVCRIQLDSSNNNLYNNRNNITRIKIATWSGWVTGSFGWGRVNVSGDAYIAISVLDFLTCRSISGSLTDSSGGALPTVNDRTFSRSYSAGYTRANATEGDYFDDLINGGSVSLGALISKNTTFGANLYNALSGNWSGTSTVSTGGSARHFKFVPGSGNTESPSSKLHGTFCTHMVKGGANNLDSVMITEGGGNSQEVDPNFAKGFYNPLLFPRVHVYVMRKVSMGFGGMYMYNMLPTRIEAVAQVNGAGLITNVHLLDVPNNPVWDDSAGTNGAYTQIYPQDISASRPTAYSGFVGSYNYQDLGFYLKIDKSTDGSDITFEINQNETVSNSVLTNSNKKDQYLKIYTSYSDYVKKLNPTPTSTHAEGIVPDTIGNSNWSGPNSAAKTFLLDDVGTALAKPTTVATISVGIEVLSLSGKRKTSLNNYLGQSCGSVITGRPSSVSLTNAGAGYKSVDGQSRPGLTITKSIYNETYGIMNITIVGDGSTINAGYKPNTKFVVYGMSKNIALGLTKTSLTRFYKTAFANFKAEVTVNDSGAIQAFTIIDRGTDFIDGGPDDQIVFMASSADVYANNSSTWYDGNGFTKWQAAGDAVLTGTTLGDNDSNFINPNIHFPKSDLVIRADSAHIVEGKITKFYIQDEGSGFSTSQSIDSVFGSVEFVAPYLSLVFSNGSLLAASIIRGIPVAGFSVLDTNVALKFATSVPSTVGLPPVNDVQNDDTAMFRSIFLDDVPIKDANDRYNYSKFHFDMRIGNSKNGTPSNTHITPSRIASDSRAHLISEEFRIPTDTKIINYPLYGPNNQDQRDYFYSHTVTNPEVTEVSVAIKINKLHYIYEGDESNLYVNLIPMLGAIAGYIIGTSLAKTIVAQVAAPNPTTVAVATKGYSGPCGGAVPGAGGGGGTTVNAGSAVAQGVAALAELAIIVAGGFLGMLVGLFVASVFSCSSPLKFLCFKVGSIIKNSGEIWPASLRIGIEYGVEGDTLKEDIIEFRGCATSAYVKDIFLHNLPASETGSASENKKNRIIKVYRYTREMNPVIGGLAEARYQIEADLLSITEHVCGYFSYPNTAIIGTRVNSRDHPSVPNRQYLIKGRLLRIPSNYFPDQPFGTNKRSSLTKDEIEGSRYNPDIWDGTFKSTSNAEWTSNPAWIIWDLLTNERYGMGKYGIKESDLDKWSFYEFARFCDEEVPVVVDGKSTTERRHMCNLYIDNQQQAYDYIKELMSIYGGKINFSAGKIYFTSDMPVSQSVMLFNNTNVTEDGFSYSSTPETQRISAVTVDYLDERDNYILKSEYVEDAAGIKEHGYTHIKIAGIGITRRGEAHRLCQKKILDKQLEKELVQFQTGLQGSYLRVGDVVDIMDNNKMSHRSGGRISEIISTNKIKIDIPVASITGASKIFLQVPVESDDDASTTDSSQTDSRRSSQFKEYSIIGTNGFEVTVSGSLDSSISRGFTWMVKENLSKDVKPSQFRIKSIREISPLKFEIVGMEYVPEKYEQIDASSGSVGSNVDSREYFGPDIIVT